MMAVNTLHLVSNVLCRGVGTTILLARCVGWCEMGRVALEFSWHSSFDQLVKLAVSPMRDTPPVVEV